MAVIVEVVEPVQSGGVVNADSVVVVEVVNAVGTPVTTTTTGVSAVEVVGYNIVQNAYVGTSAPANPYEGQVWIDIT